MSLTSSAPTAQFYDSQQAHEQAIVAAKPVALPCPGFLFGRLQPVREVMQDCFSLWHYGEILPSLHTEGLYTWKS